MAKLKNIVLIGFMGVGKTTIGKRVSAKLKIDFYDTDEAIKKCEKMPVHELLKKKGPRYFEGAQRFAVSTLAQNEGCLISTGGDTVTDSFNVAELKKNGILFWLKASPETVYKNTRYSVSKRPELENITLYELSQMIEKREEFYSTADVVISVDHDSIDDVADKIVQEYNARTNE
ncbi:MAG: shikimate kinase [Clostridia bacterium]|nr:shikimate kinase [Clostridia bacterium]